MTLRLHLGVFIRLISAESSSMLQAALQLQESEWPGLGVQMRERRKLDDIPKAEWSNMVGHLKRHRSEYITMTDEQIFQRLLVGDGICLKNSSVHKPLKELTFIHIPRTGGGTVEECSEKSHLWGYQDREAMAHWIDTGVHAKHCGHCWWHMPPNTLSSYYEGKETFCTIRNPYTRLISEFGILMERNGKVKMADNITFVNEFLYQQLQWLKQQDQEGPGRGYNDCHWVPQSGYVWGWHFKNSTVDTSKQYCKNIVHFDPDLPTSFNALMKKHGYGYHLDTEHRMHAQKSAFDLQPKHLSRKVIDLFNELFDVDFKLLGFEKL